MRARRTFRIKDLIDEVNRRNKVSTCTSQERQAWNSITEWVLMQAGSYHGFGYYGGWRGKGITDESRVFFYCGR
jgi:hypothetical protein